jgi:hypothetical protein
MPITGALNKISKMRGVYYSWVTNKPAEFSHLDDRRHIGLIAQDVLEVVPEVVNDMHNGKYLGIDYASIVALLIEGINDIQRVKIETEERLMGEDGTSNVLGDDLVHVKASIDALLKDSKVLMQSLSELESEFEELKNII